MGFIEIFLTGVGLSMDAFAVSICRGLQMRRSVNWKHLLIIAAFFGGFQALMPAIGYLLGSQFKDYIVAIDHWMHKPAARPFRAKDYSEPSNR